MIQFLAVPLQKPQDQQKQICLLLLVNLRHHVSIFKLFKYVLSADCYFSIISISQDIIGEMLHQIYRYVSNRHVTSLDLKRNSRMKYQAKVCVYILSRVIKSMVIPYILFVWSNKILRLWILNTEKIILKREIIRFTALFLTFHNYHMQIMQIGFIFLFRLPSHFGSVRCA